MAHRPSHAVITALLSLAALIAAPVHAARIAENFETIGTTPAPVGQKAFWANFTSHTLATNSNILRNVSAFTLGGWVNFTADQAWVGSMIAVSGPAANRGQDRAAINFNPNYNSTGHLGLELRAGRTNRGTYGIEVLGIDIEAVKADQWFGKWRHVMGVVDGTAKTLRLYVDGQLAASQSVGGWDTSTTDDIPAAEVTAAGEYATAWGPFNPLIGGVDDLLIETSALPASSIRAIYELAKSDLNYNLTTVQSILAAGAAGENWPGDGGDGWNFIDPNTAAARVPAGTPGTLHNAPDGTTYLRLPDGAAMAQVPEPATLALPLAALTLLHRRRNH